MFDAETYDHAPLVDAELGDEGHAGDEVGDVGALSSSACLKAWKFRCEEVEMRLCSVFHRGTMVEMYGP
jgi:hypothetical protein